MKLIRSIIKGNKMKDCYDCKHKELIATDRGMTAVCGLPAGEPCVLFDDETE